MVILETKNLIKRFEGVRAVDSLSVKVEEGKITSIIGPNGSGKSTLINLVTGMIPLDEGVLLVSGVTLENVIPHNVPLYGVTRTFQEVRLFEQMTVLDNVLVVVTERNIFGALFEKHNDYHLKKTEEVLKKIGLWDKRNQLAINLSYGQRKLLEVARALAMQAEIYLFDEPFSGLFPGMIKVVVKVMKALKEEEKTIILIDHNMDLIRELSDYIIVMDSGKLLAEGEGENVLKKREVIEAYLGE